MKIIITLVAQILTLNTFAEVNVGDIVKYNVTISEGTFKQTHVEENFVSSYDNEKEMFTIIETKTWPNYKPSITSYEVSKEDSVKLAKKFEECSELGGSWESVVVPAGEFDACAVPYDFKEEAGTVWFGDVGFGVVKVKTHFKGLKSIRTRELLSTHKDL